MSRVGRIACLVLLASAALPAGRGQAAVVESTITQEIGDSIDGVANARACSPGTACTYTESAEAPFSGTVTSFEVIAAEPAGTVRLRVLRRIGQSFEAVATSGPAPLAAAGRNTFATSLPIEQGEVIGLDDESGAMVFETRASTEPPGAAIFAPGLPEQAPREPSSVPPRLHLLLKAWVRTVRLVEAAPPNSSAGPPPAPPTTPVTSPAPLAVGHFALTHAEFRVEQGRRRRGAPVGTTFTYTLNEAGEVRIQITRILAGRLAPNGHCLAGRRRHTRLCTLLRGAADLRYQGHAGLNERAFSGRVEGRALPAGSYEATLTVERAGAMPTTPLTVRFGVTA